MSSFFFLNFSKNGESHLLRWTGTLLLFSLILSGCTASGKLDEKEGDKTGLSTAEAGDTNGNSYGKTASAAPLSPPKSMKLKEDRDGIVPVSFEIPALKVNASIEKAAN